MTLLESVNRVVERIFLRISEIKVSIENLSTQVTRNDATITRLVDLIAAKQEQVNKLTDRLAASAADTEKVAQLEAQIDTLTAQLQSANDKADGTT